MAALEALHGSSRSAATEQQHLKRFRSAGVPSGQTAGGNAGPVGQPAASGRMFIHPQVLCKVVPLYMGEVIVLLSTPLRGIIYDQYCQKQANCC
jgi:hypothetical protein